MLQSHEIIGINQIINERAHQIEIGHTVGNDYEYNPSGELGQAVSGIMKMYIGINQEVINAQIQMHKPANWNLDTWINLCNLPYLERVKIAGAWCAAEIDRLNFSYTEEILPFQTHIVDDEF